MKLYTNNEGKLTDQENVMEKAEYHINKGINKPVEFRGLKAQYVWYLGAGLLILLIVFAALYICGLNSFICLAVVGTAGTCLFIRVYQMSHQYGQYGLMKKIARRKLPTTIKIRSRRVFIRLQQVKTA